MGDYTSQQPALGNWTQSLGSFPPLLRTQKVLSAGNIDNPLTSRNTSNDSNCSPACYPSVWTAKEIRLGPRKLATLSTKD